MPRITNSVLEMTVDRIVKGDVADPRPDDINRIVCDMLTATMMILDRTGLTKAFVAQISEAVYAAYQLGRLTPPTPGPEVN